MQKKKSRGKRIYWAGLLLAVYVMGLTGCSKAGANMVETEKHTQAEHTPTATPKPSATPTPTLMPEEMAEYRFSDLQMSLYYTIHI